MESGKEVLILGNWGFMPKDIETLLILDVLS
jgi:hypothetical protein